MVKVKIIQNISEIQEPRTFYLMGSNTNPGTFDIYFTDDEGIGYKNLDKGTVLHSMTAAERSFLERLMDGRINSKYTNLQEMVESLRSRIVDIENKAEGGTINSYIASWYSGVTDGATGGDTGRRKLEVKDSFGKLHLDFKVTRSVTQLGTLPSTSPTPTSLIETQLFDGSVVWVRAGDRIVRCSGLATNTRYIVDLIGYWE